MSQEDPNIAGNFYNKYDCGEGYLANHIYNHCQPARFRASDYSAEVIQLAQEYNQTLPIEFSSKSIYDLTPDDSAELIICCEVMEHLEYPEQALSKLQALAPSQLILSVPREPLWRILNMARFKYWSDLGNTPGHLQNWSQRQFLKLVSEYFQINHIRSPYPWTMCLCSPL